MGSPTLGALLAAGIAFVVIAIALSFGMTILTDLQTDQTANSYAYNATGYGLSAGNTIAKWLPTIALVVVASIIIGLVVRYLAGRGGGV